MTRAGLCLALACVACARYVPRPLDPAVHPSQVLARDLGDSALVAVVGRHDDLPRAGRWTDRQLALAALMLRSDLRRLRAEWRAASAAVRTAGERPGIGVQGEVERRVGGRDEGGPWVIGLAALVRVELGGKRGARAQAARAGTALAESRLLASSRAVAVGARIAAMNLSHAVAEAAEAHDEVRALEEVHSLERARYAEAALGASELARTGAELQDARLEFAGAEHRALAARASLAAAVALPARALDSLVPVLGSSGACASLDSRAYASAYASLATRAVERRQEVAVSLSEYAIAESRLRLEVARQLPDLELGPGFVWDQGVNRWALAFALPALLGSRNRGPIAEAQAAREVAGLRVAEVQDSVLADVEMAAQRCRGAGLELAAADSVVAAAELLARREREAYERGETSRLEPARAELQLLRAHRARRAAERRLATASIELERAAGGPPSPEGVWPDPRQEPDSEVPRP